MASKQDFCTRGHTMETSRRYHPNGDSYCSECKKIRYDKFRKENPGRVKLYSKTSRHKKMYGLSKKDYETLIEKQKNLCAICGIPPVNKSLHIDHCHKTGKIRGLLCHGCNTAIGLMKDSRTILLKAIMYLS